MYTLTIFLSAFLLFQSELIIARHILPWFGSTPSVWTTCVLFFQVLLLAGYSYSHAVVSRLREKLHGKLHLLLLGLSLCVLAAQFLFWAMPILPDASWKPPDSSFPVSRILWIMLASVGLPFFLLSTTGPLLQAWFSRLRPGASVYRMYAFSNAGSLLALLSYPFLIEPLLPLRFQAAIWSGGYILFAVLCALCAIRAAKAHLPQAHTEHVPAKKAETYDDHAATSRWLLILLWLILPACASMLFLATTNKLAEEVAVMPFLWVLPLSIYLLSFILCFQGRRYDRFRFVMAAIAAAALVAIVSRQAAPATFLYQVGIYLFALFACCMICHGELYRLKPPAEHLTFFYLCLALGGAIGSVFVGLIAPNIFNGFWELYIGYFLCGALLVAVIYLDRNSAFHGRRRWLSRTVASVLILALAVGPFALGSGPSRLVARQRNFYGVLTVRNMVTDQSHIPILAQFHANTVHGFQAQSEDFRRVPTAYYCKESGVGIAIQHHPRRMSEPSGQAGLRIGAVGLGVGTIATYGRGGDYMRFYEINPAVVEQAKGPRRYFTYLEDSNAKIDVVIGDGRISLENELIQRRPQEFDVLVLDAFSGDAIPVHLLTSQAFDIYMSHLRSDGILAIHVSNKYFNLPPVIFKHAEQLGMGAVVIESEPQTDLEIKALWVLMTRNEKFLNSELVKSLQVQTANVPQSISVWSDDYTNVFQALNVRRWNRSFFVVGGVFVVIVLLLVLPCARNPEDHPNRPKR